MQVNLRRTLSMLAVAFVAVALLAVVIGSQRAAAQTEVFPRDTATERVIHVSGDGQAAAQPDVGVIQVGVETMADTAAAALEQNSQQTQALIDALQQGGVAAEDIQTQQIQLYPRYQEGMPPTPVPTPSGQTEPGATGVVTPTQPGLIGYTATNIVEVRVTDISQMGALLDAAVAAGGNRIQGIRFEVSDAEAAVDLAREDAWNDAMHKAEQLAALAGAELGEVISISEISQTPRPIIQAAEMAVAASAVPIEPGTQNIQVHLEVTWALREGTGATPSPTSVMTGTATPDGTVTPEETETPEGTVTPEGTETALPTLEPVVTGTVTGTLGTASPTAEITSVITATAPATATVEPTGTVTTALSMETPAVSPAQEMTATVESTAMGLPSVEISPTVGGPGSFVQVSLTGFPANDVAVVQMGVINAMPSVRRAAETDASGTLTTTLTIPQVALRGEQWIVFAFTEDGQTFASSRVFRVQ